MPWTEPLIGIIPQSCLLDPDPPHQPQGWEHSHLRCRYCALAQHDPHQGARRQLHGVLPGPLAPSPLDLVKRLGDSKGLPLGAPGRRGGGAIHDRCVVTAKLP